jgi:hypothetical protein
VEEIGSELDFRSSWQGFAGITLADPQGDDAGQAGLFSPSPYANNVGR